MVYLKNYNIYYLKLVFLRKKLIFDKINKTIKINYNNISPSTIPVPVVFNKNSQNK